MYAKERRKVKHRLKTNVDTVDKYLQFVYIGNKLLGSDVLEAKDAGNEESRTAITEHLARLKSEILSDCNSFVTEIDKLISELK